MEESILKKLTKKMLVSAATGFWGKVLVVLVAVIGFQTVSGIFSSESSKISSGNENFLTIIADFSEAIARHFIMILMFGYWLLTEKIQTGIVKERNRDEAEIRKLQLKKEILELELRKDNQQTTPNDGDKDN